MRGQFPVTKQGLADALDFLANGLAKLGVDDGVASRSAVVVDELVGNLLRHDPTLGPSDAFTMEFGADAGAAKLILSDPGQPFDPTSFARTVTPVLGGHGIDLIRTLPGEVRYRRCDGRNYLELTIDPE